VAKTTEHLSTGAAQAHPDDAALPESLIRPPGTHPDPVRGPAALGAAHARVEAAEKAATAKAEKEAAEARNADPGSEGNDKPGLPQPPTADDGPRHLSGIRRSQWWPILKRTGKQFNSDNLTVWAAALTYYGILSLFPALLVLISALRLTGRGTTQRVLDSLTSTAPGPTRTVLTTAVTNLQQGQQSTAGILAVVGVLAALWSASGYIGAFMQASNAIYSVPEGRPIWKKLPIRLGITVAAGLIVAVAALSIVFTGGLAKQVGKLLHLGSTVVLVWDIAKWPVLVLLISLLFALLYWGAPNARHGGFRWVTPGSLVAVLVWIAASAGFAVYVGNFGSYNKTYGSLAAVIVFLVWMWISNLAVLLGAELDAEIQRSRAVQAGHPAGEEPYMALRDDHSVDAGDEAAL
jgi:membrane protein